MGTPHSNSLLNVSSREPWGSMLSTGGPWQITHAHHVVEQRALATALRPHDGYNLVVGLARCKSDFVHKAGNLVLAIPPIAGDHLHNLRHGPVTSTDGFVKGGGGGTADALVERGTTTKQGWMSPTYLTTTSTMLAGAAPSCIHARGLQCTHRSCLCANASALMHDVPAALAIGRGT